MVSHTTIIAIVAICLFIEFSFILWRATKKLRHATKELKDASFEFRHFLDELDKMHIKNQRELYEIRDKCSLILNAVQLPDEKLWGNIDTSNVKPRVVPPKTDDELAIMESRQKDKVL